MLISFEKGNVSLYFIKHTHCPYICTCTVCSVCRGLHGSTGSRAHRRVPAPRACGCQREALGAAPRGRPGGGPRGRLCPRSQGTSRWVSACRDEAGGGGMLPTCRLQCLRNDHLLPLPQKSLSLEMKPFFHFENVADFYSFVCIAFEVVGSICSTESVQNQ